MIGRELGLGALGAALEAAAAGRGQFVLVVGEAGIGKTALVAALAEEATGSGALVLWGQCWEGGGAPAYWPWVQVLRSGMAAGGDAGEAARLLPEAAAPTAAGGGEPPDARFRLFDAMARHLAGLAASRPVVVVLDDLQWADESSLAMLEFCARHLQAAPVLVLGAYRDEEAPATVRRVAASAQLVPLGGLAAGEVAQLLTAVLGAEPRAGVAEVVWRRTGGNPLFAGELARLHAASGDHHTVMQQRPVVPASVREVLERRLARLSQRCADVLAIAAVMGPDVRLEVVNRVAHDVDDVAGALDEAVAARVLVGPEAPVGPYRFSHDLFREVILAGLPSDVRSRLHLAVGRAFEALEEHGAPVHPAELALHFAAAAPAAPEEARRYGMRAGEDAAARLAFEEACAHYERALAALDLDPRADGAARLELLVRLGEVRNRAGHASTALAAYRDAMRVARRLGDASGLARSAIGIHGLGWRTSHAESIARLEEAARALPEHPSVLRARVLACLARDLHHSRHEPDWERATALAEQAVAVARHVDDVHTLAFCLFALHDARWRPGTAARRLPVIDEMSSAGHAAGDLEMVAQATLLRATARIELGDPQGVADLESYCRMAEDLGHARARYAALSRRATVALLAGRIEEAEERADEAFALGRSIGEPDAEGVHETLLWAARRVGSTRPAGTYSLDSDPWPGLPLAESVVRLAQGDVDAARRVLTRLRLEDLPRTYDLEVFAFAAEAVAAAGSAEQQAKLHQMLRPHAGTTSSWGAAPPTAAPSTITWACCPDHSGTSATPGDTSSRPSPSTSGSALRRGRRSAGPRPTRASGAKLRPRACSAGTGTSGPSPTAATSLTSATSRACATWPSSWPGPAVPCTPSSSTPAARPTPAPTPCWTTSPRPSTGAGWWSWRPTSTRRKPPTTPTGPSGPRPSAMPWSPSSPPPSGSAGATADWATTRNGPARPSPPGSGTPWTGSSESIPCSPSTSGGACRLAPGASTRRRTLLVGGCRGRWADALDVEQTSCPQQFGQHAYEDVYGHGMVLVGSPTSAPRSSNG